MIILKQSTYNDPTLEGGKFQELRDKIQNEINGVLKGDAYSPKAKVISFEMYEKTPAERLQLKEMKAINKRLLLSKGLNPKKVMNVPAFVNEIQKKAKRGNRTYTKK